MVSLTLTVVLLSAFVPLFATSIDSWQRGYSRSEVQQTARVAVDSMVRDLKYGSNFSKISDNEIAFTDSHGRSSRYRLDTTSHILYNILSNGTPQPVTGVNVKDSTNVLIYGNYGVAQALFDWPSATETGRCIFILPPLIALPDRVLRFIRQYLVFPNTYNSRG
jgi:type II secretory pathway pseudopilin PulG